MMKRSSHLNQPLQETLFGALRRQPYRFPMFMRGEELPGVEAVQAFS